MSDTDTPAPWDIARMDGFRISHPFIVRNPTCPKERHPTRDCGCRVFRTMREAETYRDERNAT